MSDVVVVVVVQRSVQRGCAVRVAGADQRGGRQGLRLRAEQPDSRRGDREGRGADDGERQRGRPLLVKQGLADADGRVAARRRRPRRRRRQDGRRQHKVLDGDGRPQQHTAAGRRRRGAGGGAQAAGRIVADTVRSGRLEVIAGSGPHSATSNAFHRHGSQVQIVGDSMSRSLINGHPDARISIDSVPNNHQIRIALL